MACEFLANTPKYVRWTTKAFLEVALESELRRSPDLWNFD